MKWSKVGMVCCGILFVCGMVEAVQHIGFCRNWEGQFFSSGLDNGSIICNTLICALYWLREAFDYAQKDF